MPLPTLYRDYLDRIGHLARHIPDFQVIDGGYRVHATLLYFIDIMEMYEHWRICETRRRPYGFYDGFWNYPSLDTAVLYARDWIDATGCLAPSEPVGWEWCWRDRETHPRPGLSLPLLDSHRPYSAA